MRYDVTQGEKVAVLCCRSEERFFFYALALGEDDKVSPNCVIIEQEEGKWGGGDGRRKRKKYYMFSLGENKFPEEGVGVSVLYSLCREKGRAIGTGTETV